jgi:hypothetical protein
MKKYVNFYESNSLECPSCNNPNLHQRKVSTFWRIEDSNTGVCVISQFGHTLIDEKAPQHLNPSPRRDGILIDFECEHCKSEPRLAIYQHKGFTYVEWESMRQAVKD